MLDLIVFTRPFHDPAAKSRLKSTSGFSPEKVVGIHNAMLEHTLKTACSFSDVRLHVYWSKAPLSEPFLASEVTERIQKGENFEDRFLNCLKDFSHKNSSGFVVIGSDCPGLTPEHLSSAIHGVKSGQVVIGPEQKGGFYLLGLPKGTDLSLLKDTLKMKNQPLALKNTFGPLRKILLLDELRDLDSHGDYLSLKDHFAHCVD